MAITMMGIGHASSGGISIPSNGLVFDLHANDAVGTNNEEITAWPARVGVAMTSSSNNPYLANCAFVGSPGVKFAKGEVARYSDASFEIVGDLSVYYLWSEIRHNHWSGVGQMSVTISSDANKLYDNRIDVQQLDTFHEYASGSNEGPTAIPELRFPHEPSVFGMRRNTSTKVIDFEIRNDLYPSSSTTSAYANNPTGGGGSADILIGAFDTAASVSPIAGILGRMLVYNRRLGDAEHDMVMKTLHSYGPEPFSLGTQSGSWAATAGSQQGCVTDGTHIWMSVDNVIEKFTVAGSSVESVTDNPGLTSWGDLEIYGDLIYAVRYSASASNAIYSFDKDDLASGSTLVKTLSDVPDTGVNGLIRLSDGRWLVCHTGGSSSAWAKKHRMYILTSSFVYESTIEIPVIQQAGIQSITRADDGDFYWSMHGSSTDVIGTSIHRGRLVSDEIYCMFSIHTALNVGAICHDGVGTLYLLERDGSTARVFNSFSTTDSGSLLRDRSGNAMYDRAGNPITVR